jgi:hypothetical protein
MNVRNVMIITLETQAPETGLLEFNVKVRANIRFSATEARRKVSVFVGNQIADLLHGETPDLVIGEKRSFWRVPVVLGSRSLGRIGVVGKIDVDVESGEMTLSEKTIWEIEQNAERFSAGAAL